MGGVGEEEGGGGCLHVNQGKQGRPSFVNHHMCICCLLRLNWLHALAAGGKPTRLYCSIQGTLPGGSKAAGRRVVCDAPEQQALPAQSAWRRLQLNSRRP